MLLPKNKSLRTLVQLLILAGILWLIILLTKGLLNWQMDQKITPRASVIKGAFGGDHHDTTGSITVLGRHSA